MRKPVFGVSDQVGRLDISDIGSKGKRDCTIVVTKAGLLRR